MGAGHRSQQGCEATGKKKAGERNEIGGEERGLLGKIPSSDVSFRSIYLRSRGSSSGDGSHSEEGLLRLRQEIPRITESTIEGTPRFNIKIGREEKKR